MTSVPTPGWQRVDEGTFAFYVSEQGQWGVADNGRWVPGAYASQDAARMAAGLCATGHLVALRDRINRVSGQYRPISLADLVATPNGGCCQPVADSPVPDAAGTVGSLDPASRRP